MTNMLALVVGLLTCAGAHARDVADSSAQIHAGFLSKYMLSDASKNSVSDYDQFVTHSFTPMKHGPATDDSQAIKITDKEEEVVAQKLVRNESNMPIVPSMLAFGAMLVAILGLRKWRQLQQATTASQPMWLPTSAASANNVLELKAQDSSDRFGQHAGKGMMAGVSSASAFLAPSGVPARTALAAQTLSPRSAMVAEKPKTG